MFDPRYPTTCVGADLPSPSNFFFSPGEILLLHPLLYSYQDEVEGRAFCMTGESPTMKLPKTMYIYKHVMPEVG